MRAKEFISETTTAGGVATVVGGLGPAITRDASIYGNKKPGKKKKKKSGKYSNSITEGRDKSTDIEIDTPEVKFVITYDDRPGIRSWFLEGYMKSGSRDSYVYTKDDKFTREIPIELVSFSDYKRFPTSNDAIRALRSSNFYKKTNRVTEGASTMGFGKINSMEFWDQVATELEKHPAITEAILDEAESSGDTDSGWRYIKFEIDFRDEYIHFDMDMRWGDNADGTYGKPFQHWTFTGYPDGNVLKDEKYRVEVYENPKDEARKIINTLMDI